MDTVADAEPAHSADRLPWVEVPEHPKFGLASMVLLGVATLGTAASAAVVLAVAPPAELNDSQRAFDVLLWVSIGFCLWLGWMAVKRLKERLALKRAIARMLSGEPRSPQAIAQLAWGYLSPAAFTPESLEALEVSWSMKLPRVWVVRPKTPGLIARTLNSLETKRPTHVAKPEGQGMAAHDRRVIWRVAALFISSYVVVMTGTTVVGRHPALGAVLFSLAGIAMIAGAIQLEQIPWTVLHERGTLLLRRSRHSRWPWARNPASLPTLEIVTDRDVVVLMPQLNTLRPDGGTTCYCRISVALRAVASGQPTDFRGLLADVPAGSPLAAAIRTTNAS